MRSPEAVRGSAVVRHDGSRWFLRVGGQTTGGTQSEGSLSFVLGDDTGTLRGAPPPSVGTWFTHWVQPGGMANPFATPVRLVRQANGHWQGTITPHDVTFTLQLDIRRGSDGTLEGRFLNPEMGWNLGRVFRVARAGNNITLADPATGTVRLTQEYDSAARTIMFDFGAPLHLRRVMRPEAEPSRRQTYRYRAPAAGEDQWTTGHASAAGLDPSVLGAMVQRVLDTDPLDATQPQVHSIQVARHGRLVLDEYFAGYDAERLHDTRSAFKSVVSLMVGIASDRGALRAESSVDSLLGRTLSTRRGIQMQHLLAHTSGLACDDNDASSPGGEEQMQSQRTQRDWAQHIADLPVVRTPGTHYAYCSGGIHLAGTLVARRTGQWLPTFFHETLARPLGINRYAMNLTPTGEGYGGGGTQLRPRDLLKFGQLVVGAGKWKGRQVVSADWITRSTAHVVTTPDSGSDGLGWHRHTIQAAGRSWQVIEANGNGGQLVMAVPELDLVVGFTAGSYNRYRAWRLLREEFLPKYVLAALKAPAGRVRR